MDTIYRVKERINPRLEVEGILATMYDSRTLHGREVLARVVDAFGEKVFHTVIARTVREREATIMRRLNEDQAAGRTCCYCPLTFGKPDLVLVPTGTDGVLFLAAHPSCIPAGGDVRIEGCVAAHGRRERS